MSDSVRMLSANGVDRGFPGGKINDTPPNDVHPITADIQTLIKWYWRVKLWSLSTDFTMTDTGGAPFAMTNGTIPAIAGTPTRELNLVLDSNFATGQHHSWANPQTNDNAAFQLFQDSMGIVWRDSGNLYPYLNIDAGIINPVNSEAVSLVSAFPAFPFALNGTIDGISVPLYFNASAPPNAPASYSVTHFDLTPVEYWPHKGLNGNPVYNTSTGDQLQSPLL